MHPLQLILERSYGMSRPVRETTIPKPNVPVEETQEPEHGAKYAFSYKMPETGEYKHFYNMVRDYPEHDLVKGSSVGRSRLQRANIPHDEPPTKIDECNDIEAAQRKYENDPKGFMAWVNAHKPKEEALTEKKKSKRSMAKSAVRAYADSAAKAIANYKKSYGIQENEEPIEEETTSAAAGPFSPAGAFSPDKKARGSERGIAGSAALGYTEVQVEMRNAINKTKETHSQLKQ